MRLHVPVLVLAAGLTAGEAWADEPRLRGYVSHYDGKHKENRPSGRVWVQVKGFGPGRRTDSDGAFRLVIPDEFGPGDEVTVAVRKKGYRVFRPEAGRLRVPSEPDKDIVRVRLLPADALLLREEHEVRAEMQRFARRAVRRAKKQAEAAAREHREGEREADYGRLIREWAVDWGMSVEDAQQAVQAWAAEVEQRKTADRRERALAAVAKKELAQAARLLEESARERRESLARLRAQAQGLASRIAKQRRELVRDLRLQGDVYEAAYRFAEAVGVYEQARDELVREADPPELWAAVQVDLGDARTACGIRGEGEAVHSMLEEAVAAYRLALQVYVRDTLPQDWATTQTNLGNALRQQGIRTDGQAGADLLAEAVRACRLALEVRTRDTLPQDWAMTQHNLGNALQEQGIRTGGQVGAGLLAEAVGAYRLALEVRTRDTLPEHWATTQNALGAALWQQGNRTDGQAGADLLAEAVRAYRLALQVYVQDTLPQQRATTQNNLGIALQEQGIRTGGQMGADLLAQAVRAYRLALRVYARDTLPQQWAVVQNNLGNVLKEQGIRTGGRAAVDLLSQAVSAYRLALKVHARDTLPQGWAMTQNNLGSALRGQGIRTSGQAGTDLLAQAVRAYRLALQVYARDTLPGRWALVERNLARTLGELSHRVASEDHRALVDAAADTWDQLLQAFPEERSTVLVAAGAYHDDLLRYETAHAVCSSWLRRHPADLEVSLQALEASLTTGRYPACEQQAGLLAASDKLVPGHKAVASGLRVACLAALGRRQEAVSQLDRLLLDVRTQADDFGAGWKFPGTRAYLRGPSGPAGDREALLALFDALELTGRQAVLDRLGRVRELLADADPPAPASP